MNEKVFEIWFENAFLPKLPRERNVVIVMEMKKNITLSSLERFSQWIWKENDMIKFMVKHSIVIFNLVPAKPVLLEKIRERNIPKQYIIDSVAKKVGYDVLWLHPNTT